MKILTDKKMIQKIMIILVILILFNFIIPNYSNAGTGWSGVAGVLFEPIMDIFLYVADTVLYVSQWALLGTGTITISLNGDGINGTEIGVGILATVVGAGLIVLSGGAFLPLVIGVAALGYGVTQVVAGIKNDVKIPTIQISPQEIFADKIPAFDVNFISPNDYELEEIIIERAEEYTYQTLDTATPSFFTKYGWDWDASSQTYTNNDISGGSLGAYSYNTAKQNAENAIEEAFDNGYSYVKLSSSNLTGWVKHYFYAWKIYNEITEQEEIYRCYIKYEFFTWGDDYTIVLFTQNDSNVIGYTEIITNTSTAKILQNTIATWYVALRNLSMVGLLSVLVYIGIRILLSSAASDKAKYKQMIWDWVVAICLLFFMHYIMSFTLTVTGTISDMLSQNNGYIEVTELSLDVDTDALAGLEEGTFELSDDGKLTSIQTNLIGYARLVLQVQDDMSTAFGYFIIYLVLTVYTIVFVIMYAKRVIYMGFLTLIAPLVTLTYPIDKISDGKAQAFRIMVKRIFI